MSLLRDGGKCGARNHGIHTGGTHDGFRAQALADGGAVASSAEDAGTTGVADAELLAAMLLEGAQAAAAAVPSSNDDGQQQPRDAAVDVPGQTQPVTLGSTVKKRRDSIGAEGLLLLGGANAAAAEVAAAVLPRPRSRTRSRGGDGEMALAGGFATGVESPAPVGVAVFLTGDESDDEQDDDGDEDDDDDDDEEEDAAEGREDDDEGAAESAALDLGVDDGMGEADDEPPQFEFAHDYVDGYGHGGVDGQDHQAVAVAQPRKRSHGRGSRRRTASRDRSTVSPKVRRQRQYTADWDGGGDAWMLDGEEGDYAGDGSGGGTNSKAIAAAYAAGLHRAGSAGAAASRRSPRSGGVRTRSAAAVAAGLPPRPSLLSAGGSWLPGEAVGNGEGGDGASDAASVATGGARSVASGRSRTRSMTGASVASVGTRTRRNSIIDVSPGPTVTAPRAPP